MGRNISIEGLSLPPIHPHRIQADRLLYSYDNETIKQDGIIRWRFNGQVPPQDVLDFWKHVGKKIQHAKVNPS